ncbi:lyase family protein [Crystallibacter degradans]|uniref:lyase family protein n=1 Tax=Crystallibacter degradans TaxID=2726743 RepID=UPI0014758136|nr:lyase family protein [Arthrobacter sp. SF27]NMR29465.1 adenylosuccinate lyase family protein [Arthrobacter sp. SF27]
MNPADNADFGLLSPASAGTAASRLTSDYQFIQAMLDVELEWVRVLADAGYIDAGLVPAVEAASAAEQYDAASVAERAQGGGNPVIPLLGDLRARVKEASPAAAAAIHKGATSQDILDSALLLMASRTLEVILADLKTTASALARLADTHRGTVTVARTLTQHSLPSTFGLKAANWLSGVGQAGVQLSEVAGRLPLQWGGAAGTMAALTAMAAKGPQNKTANNDGGALALAAQLAGRLGLADPVAPWQTNRLPVTALAAALADVLAAAGKVANDVLLLSRPEFGELSEPRAEGRGVSSAMPQKQNPVLSVLIRSAALAAPGHLAQVQAAAAGAIDERPDGSWHVEWQALRQLLRLAGGAAAKLAELTDGLVVHADRMQENLAITGPLVVSEKIMATVAPLLDDGAAGSGKPKVQALVNESLSGGTPFTQLLRGAVPQHKLSEADLQALLDPAGYLGQSDELITRIIEHFSDWSQA